MFTRCWKVRNTPTAAWNLSNKYLTLAWIVAGSDIPHINSTIPVVGRHMESVWYPPRLVFFYNAWPSDDSLSNNSCGVNKSACLRMVCTCMNRNLPWTGSRAQKYILLHSNTVFVLVGPIMWLLRTNESTILLRRKIHFGFLNSSCTRKRFSGKPCFWRRNYYLINYDSEEAYLVVACRHELTQKIRYYRWSF